MGENIVISLTSKALEQAFDHILQRVIQLATTQQVFSMGIPLSKMLLDWVGPERLARIQEATEQWIEFLSPFASVIGGAFSGLYTILSKSFQGIYGVLTSVTNFVGETLLVVFQSIPAVWDGDMKRLTLVVWEWAKHGVLPIFDSIKNLAKTVLETVFDSLPDAWKDSLSKALGILMSWVGSVLSTLSNLLGGSSGIGSILSSAIGFFSGNPAAGASAAVGSSQVGRFTLPGFAEGGRISAGQVSVVGERGPEVFVPKQSGTIVPSGGGTSMGFGSVETKIDIKIRNYGKDQVQTKTRQQGPGHEEIEIMIGNAVASDLRRGGRAAQMIESVYGTKRAGGRRA